MWHVVVERGTTAEPNPVKANCRLMLPNRAVTTSLASDAPAHVRALAESGEAESAE
jgi:hypothetical protein